MPANASSVPGISPLLLHAELAQALVPNREHAVPCCSSSPAPVILTSICHANLVLGLLAPRRRRGQRT